MKRFTSISFLFLALACALAQTKVLAEESGDWKESNSRAIAAMRNEKYSESERLFQQALKECPLPEDRKIVNTNLALLLQKLGREHEAKTLTGEIEKTNKLEPEAKPTHILPRPNAEIATVSATIRPGGIRGTIQQLDAEIVKADAAGQLETLQNLFAKKAEALRIRDKAETLDYAYALHFRAQVLHHMGKMDEAQALETRATHIRDAIRRLSTQTVHAPAVNHRSNLGRLNFNFDYDDPPPSNAQDSYPSSASGNDSIDYAHQNPIDRNTTNIHKTPSATNTLNSERNFGR